MSREIITDTLKELIDTKTSIENQINRQFTMLKTSCKDRELKKHKNQCEWFQCNHIGYIMREYFNVRPCNFEKCPLLKDKKNEETT